MTRYSRGDVVLVSLALTGEAGAMQRPAVIVSSNTYHRQRQELIISPITGRINRILAGDYLIRDWQEAGLLFPSLATGMIRTIKQNMLRRKLGSLSQDDLKELDKRLGSVLGIA